MTRHANHNTSRDISITDTQSPPEASCAAYQMAQLGKRRVSFTTALINLTVVRLSYDSSGKASSSAWRVLHRVLSVARWKKRLVRVAEMVSLQLLILRIIWTLDSSFGEGLPAGYHDEIGLAFEAEKVLFGFGTIYLGDMVYSIYGSAQEKFKNSLNKRGNRVLFRIPQHDHRVRVVRLFPIVFNHVECKRKSGPIGSTYNPLLLC